MVVVFAILLKKTLVTSPELLTPCQKQVEHKRFVVLSVSSVSVFPINNRLLAELAGADPCNSRKSGGKIRLAVKTHLI